LEKIKIDISNCYGITKLNTTFNLGYEKDHKHSRIISIYAPNGTMKTSLTKCFKDWQDKKESKDLRTDTIGTKSISIDDNKLNNDDEISDKIHVIQSYIQNYKSNDNNIQKLLLNTDLQQELTKATEELEKAKNNLSITLNNSLKINKKDNFLNTVIKFVKSLDSDSNPQNNNSKTDYDILINLKDILNYYKQDNLINKYKELKYLTIFDEKVKKFIEINKENLDKYLNKYNDLIKESNWFDGIMDHKNFEDIKNSLTNNNFFNRKDNKIIVSDSKNQSIKEMDEQELKQIINEEMKKITEDKDLNNIWDKINKAFDANLSTRDFYGFIKQNPWLIPDLQDLTTLQKKIITSYFLQIEDSYNDYIEIYNSTKDNINNIETQAKDETNKTKWQEVIKIFNNRFFYLPYAVEIDNTIDSILGRGTPKIITKFKNSDKEVDNDNQNTLSEGEKRTLYLLHVIFDLEQLKTTTTDKILIIDDIVDSFDYKNKHAILEYINDTMNNQNIYLIILTHSFDLYRSIANIFQLTINYISNKTETETKIIKITENTKKDTKTSINPIKYWLELKNHKDFICSIPLIRNLLDYKKGDNSLQQTLNKVVHYPLRDSQNNNTNNENHIALSVLYTDITTYLNLSPQHTIDGLDLKSNKTFYDLVIKTADIILTPDNLIQESESTYFNTNLQDKIIISIAIRLLLEKKIIEKYNNDNKISNFVNHNRTRRLINKLKTDYTVDDKIKGLIDIVNMISSNNIHINSFIYEPLIDINIEDLINRYTELENTDLSNLTSK
jgi:hypothetical protein